MSFLRVSIAVLGLCALFLLIAYSFAKAARPLEGTVRDALALLPVPHALVELSATGEVVQADAEGRFVFPSLPDGTYRLCVRRIGYAERCDISFTIGPEESLDPVVHLTSTSLEGSPLEVTDERTLQTESNVVVTRNDIEETGAANAAEVLDHSPEVEILRQSNGAAWVSIRGSLPEGVKVLVDDVPLAPSGQAADLSTLSAHDIEKIEIVRGPAVTVAGADAMAGAVLITTRRGYAASTAYGRGVAGSFGRREGVAGVDGMEFFGQSFAGSFTTARGEGDFDYFDDQLQSDTVRANNDSFRRAWSVGGSGGGSSHWKWSAGAQWFDLEAGVPGAEFERTPEASRSQKRSSGSARLEYRTGPARVFASYSMADDWNHFVNTGTLPYNTEQRNHWYLWRGGAHLESGQLLRLSLSGEWTQEDLWGKDHRISAYDFGTAARTSRAVTAEWTPRVKFDSEAFREVSLQMAYRYDYSRTEAAFPRTPISPVIDPPRPVWELGSPNVALSSAGRLVGVDWSARGSYGRAFRRPPMLEQFWVESYRSRGNPGLRPERTEQWEAGYALGWPALAHLHVEQRFYWGAYEDLIFWRTGQGGAWTPDNIGRARIDGREESVECAVAGRHVTFRVDHLFADHENTAGEPNTDGEPLPFRYRHKVVAGTRGETGWGWCDVSYRWYDRRYLREAGTASKSLDPYGVFDVVAGVRRKFGSLTAELVSRVLNVGSTEYELIEREPMPGRSYSVSLNLSTTLR